MGILEQMVVNIYHEVAGGLVYYYICSKKC